MYRWMAFFDFDGTITSEETFYGSMLRLNPEPLKGLRQSFLEGKVKLRDGVNQIFSETPSAQFPVIEQYIKDVPLRNGFGELLAYFKNLDIPVVVISGGITQLIDTALAPHRERITDIYSLFLDLSENHMRLISEFDDGEDMMAKTRVMDRYQYENAICIGDGITDLKMARRSSLVFARDDLKTLCEREHLPYAAWDDFYDIIEVLKNKGVTNNLDEEAVIA